MSDYDDNFWNCPSCSTPLWKAKAQTGNFCHACGTRLTVRTFTREFEYDQRTFGAALFGFIKGFIIAGLIGLLFGAGLISGILWGIAWGCYRYHTGTPDSAYGHSYLSQD